MNLDLFFPTPIWWEDTVGIDTESILDLCLQLRNEDNHGRRLSNQGGWQSRDFEGGTHPQLQILEKKIIDQAHQCARDYGYAESEYMISMGNMWFNINGKNHSNSVHIHDNAFVSGVFYIKARPGQGAINLYKCYSQDYVVASACRIERYTPISSSAVSYQPMTGKLIMFPGNLPHGVEGNESEEERVSISFNVKLMRTIDGLYWAKNFKRD